MLPFRSTQSGFAHLLLIVVILIGLGVGLYLVQQKTNLFSKASSADIEQLTSQLEALSSSGEGRSAQSSNVGEMLGIASERKEKLLAELETDPEAFLGHARLAHKHDQFPEAIQPYIEKEQLVEGRLSLTYADKFEIEKAVLIHSLLNEQQEVVATVHGLKDVDIVSGDLLSVRGIGIGTNVAIQSSSDIQVLSSNSRSAAGIDGYNATGTEQVLVVPVNFISQPSRPLTQSALADKMTRIAEFFKTSSYQKFDPQFEVRDWITIDGDPNGCAWNSTSQAVNNRDDANDWVKLVQDASPALKQSKRIIYVFDKPPGCLEKRTAGYGSLVPQSYGGKSSFSTVSEALVFMWGDATTYIHEFGHNLGLGHASYLDCHGKIIDVFESCEDKEYGDYNSVMAAPTPVKEGDQGVPDFNAPAKHLLGWFSGSHVRTVNSNGVFKITPLESSRQGIKTLIINKPDNPSYKYYLSYRRPPLDPHQTFGYISKGVSIHLWNNSGRTEAYNQQNAVTFNKSWILGPSQLQPTLTDGSSFADPLNNITVKQISHDDQSVTVDVRLGNSGGGIIPAPLQAYQILLDGDGKTAYSRRCPIHDSVNQAISWDQCSKWLAESVEEITGVTGASYTSIDSFVLSSGADEYLNFIFMEANGQSGTAVRCNVTSVTESGLTGQECESSRSISFSNLRGLSDERYSAIASYTVSKNGELRYEQSLVEQSGQTGYARSCAIQNGVVNFSSCSNWQTVSFTNLRGLQNERYYSVTNFILKNADGGNLQQSLLDFNGMDGYYRNCQVRTAGVSWDSCSNWSLVPFGGLRGGTNEHYKSITTYIISAK